MAHVQCTVMATATARGRTATPTTAGMPVGEAPLAKRARHAAPPAATATAAAADMTGAGEAASS